MDSMSWKKKYKKPPSKKKKDLTPGKIYKSWRDDKKLVVRVKKGSRDELVHFGQTGYSDYTIHKNKGRRERYLQRSAGIRDKKGRLTKDDPFSSNYWSRKILW
jgi:hypothetical protein